jgi:catalase
VSNESKRPPLSHASGTPVTDNLNIQTAGPRGPALLQDVWLIEKLAHFHREVIPERLCVPRTSNPTIVVMKSAKDGA